MVTSKQWREFNKYRDKIYQEIINSKEWKELKVPELPQPETRKEKFLCWEQKVEYVPTPLAYFLHTYDLENFFLMQRFLLSKVPPKTVEACLDWLSTKKKK